MQCVAVYAGIVLLEKFQSCTHMQSSKNTSSWLKYVQSRAPATLGSADFQHAKSGTHTKLATHKVRHTRKISNTRNVTLYSISKLFQNIAFYVTIRLACMFCWMRVHRRGKFTTNLDPSGGIRQVQNMTNWNYFYMINLKLNRIHTAPGGAALN